MNVKERGYKGLLITFEKTAEGLGGTTQSKRLVEALKARGYDAVWTRELGGTGIGKDLRKILLDPDNSLSRAAELFITQADRAQHYEEVLKPALTAGKIVVSDRYVDSTIGWQGGGRGWDEALLWQLHAVATNWLLPDLTFLLDGTSHRTVLNDDRFEALGDGFFDRVKERMLTLTKYHGRFVIIDANRSIDEVEANILEVAEERLLKGWEHAHTDTGA